MKKEKKVILKEKGKVIEFPFHILGSEAEKMKEFKLKKKRAYINLSGLIASTINDILALDKDDEVLLNYCQLKHQIVIRDEYPRKEFIEDLYDILIDDTLINIANSYVEDNYISFLVEKELKKNSTQSLQFTDYHCKVLLKISMIQKTIIPVILEYANSFEVRDIDKFLEFCYDDLFKIFEQDNLIINKLYQTVSSKITITQYSDQVFWNFAQNYGVDIHSFISIVLSKIIVESIPKYMFDKNVISLNHVIINNTRDNYFRLNFPIKFKETVCEDDGLDQFDKLEVMNSKIDESKSYYYDIILKETVSEYTDYWTPERISEYRDIRINREQMKLMFLYYGKKLNVPEIILNCNYTQYLILLLNAVKELKEEGFKVLPDLLLANIEKKKDKKIINKKQLVKLINSDKLNEILETNYSVNKGIESNIITGLFSNMLNPIFVDRKTGDEIEYNQDILCNDLLRFIERSVM